MAAAWLKRRPLPEHLKVPWGIVAALIVYVAAWLVLPTLLAVIVGLLSPFLTAARQLADGIINGGVVANFIFTIASATAGLGIVWLYLRRHHAGWQMVGWRRFSWRQALIYLIIIAVLFLIGIGLLLALVALLVPGFNADQSQTNEFTSQTVAHPIITLLALVILPPIIEETVFRGFIFPAFAKKLGVIWGALISSVLFGFAHLQGNVSVYTFVLGLLLCFMYVRLRSIFPGMALHMLNNYLAFIALSQK